MARRLVSTALVMTLVSVTAYAVVLRAATASAFNRYVRLTEQRIAEEVSKPAPFLWIDTVPPPRRAELDKGLHQGGVIVEKLVTQDGSKSIDVPDGLIHHWVGTVFVPHATVAKAVALMQDYNKHSTYFAPNIVSSRTLEQQGDRFKVALRFNVKKVISVTLDTENDAEFFRLAPDRAHSRIRSTRVTEIADAGTPTEAATAPGAEHGFMWNLNTYWRFLERDGGTYIQCESLTLSRDVPFALGWIIRPFITQVPRESLNFTLAHVRDALTAR